MSASIYLEGGGDSKELTTRCREGFRKLLERCGFAGRMPKLVACGGRAGTFDMFQTEHGKRHATNYVAMLIDSEDPVVNPKATWAHLAARDGWKRPDDSIDEQVLLMTTCMETWIISDRTALAKHYGSKLQRSALPSLADMETRPRSVVQGKLAHATRKCSNSFSKGKRSFEVLGLLDPETLAQRLPSFVRAQHILGQRL